MASIYKTEHAEYLHTTKEDDDAIYTAAYRLIVHQGHALNKIDRGIIDGMLSRMDSGKSPTQKQWANVCQMLNSFGETPGEVAINGKGDLSAGQDELKERRQAIHRMVRSSFGLIPDLPTYTTPTFAASAFKPNEPAATKTVFNPETPIPDDIAAFLDGVSKKNEQPERESYASDFLRIAQLHEQLAAAYRTIAQGEAA